MLAIVAFAWQVLLPLAHASVAPGLVPVCSAAGTAWVDTGEGMPGDGQRAPLGHCPLCGGGAPLAAVSSGDQGGSFVPATTQFAVDTRAHLHVAIYAAAPPPSRAPPAAF